MMEDIEQSANAASDVSDDERIVAREREGKLADAREYALTAARAAKAAREFNREAELLARASELALYTQGAETAEILAREACEQANLDVGDPGRSATARISARLALARVHLRRHTEGALDEADSCLDGIDGDIEAANRVLAESGKGISQEKNQPGEYRLAAHLQATRLKLTGLVSARRGRPRRAIACLQQAYQTADGYPEVRARVLLTWAVQLRNWGLFEDARRRAERSLEIRLQLGDHYGAAMCYGTLGFIYQRQGLWERERDALVADLRVCERIGGTADMPGLHARLAGALVGMGKYVGATDQAEKAIATENRRLGLGNEDIEGEQATRVHAFAWRELARIRLAQGRLQAGLMQVGRAAGVFERLRDSYGRALCHLTEAQLHLAVARDAAEGKDLTGASEACARVDLAVASAQPAFVRFGAVPEAAESIVIQVESQHVLGKGEQAAALIAQQVLPMLLQAGLGNSTLFRRAQECLHRVAPQRAIENTVTRAAMLRSLAAILTETEPQPGTAVVAALGDEHTAHQFVLQAIDQGAVVLWPDSVRALAVVLGADHETRAAALIAATTALLGGADSRVASASGAIDLEHMWPTGVRARGEPVERALDAVQASVLLSTDAP